MGQIKCQKVINAPRPKVFAYLSNPLSLPEQLADSIDVEVQNIPPQLEKDSFFSYLMTRYGFSQPVKFKVDDVKIDQSISFHQTTGLFQKWEQRENYEDHEEGTLVTILVEYQLPMGLFGYILDDLYVRQDMQGILQGRLEKAAQHFL